MILKHGDVIRWGDNETNYNYFVLLKQNNEKGLKAVLLWQRAYDISEKTPGTVFNAEYNSLDESETVKRVGNIANVFTVVGKHFRDKDK